MKKITINDLGQLEVNIEGLGVGKVTSSKTTYSVKTPEGFQKQSFIYVVFKDSKKHFEACATLEGQSESYFVELSLDFGNDLYLDTEIPATEIEFPETKTINPNKLIKKILSLLEEALESDSTK